MFATSEAIIEFFSDRALHDEADRYIRTHAKRFAFLLEHVSRVRADLAPPDESVSILDVGPSFFTELLRQALPHDAVFTLGFDAAHNRGGHFPSCVRHDTTTHYAFDLNDSADQAG